MSSLLDELLVGLGFEYDPKEMSDFKKDIDGSVNLVKNLTKAVVGAATALTALVVTSTKASDEQGKFANEIGISVEMLDALQFSLVRSGGSADGMSSSLKSFSKNIADAVMGSGSGIEAFGRLGISIQDANGQLKPTSDLLLEVSERMQGLDRRQQIELADKLGLSDSLRLLQQGPKAIRELINEAEALGNTTAEDAAIAAEFQDSLTNLWKIIKDLSRSISRELAPMMTELVSTFTDWWKANRDIIQQKIPEWIDKFTQALKLLSIAVAVFIGYKLAAYFVTLIGLIKGVTVGALLMNAAMFILPMLIAGIITAIGLLAEDAKVFFEGGESFIGSMLEKYPQWADEIRVVAALFATIADLTAKIFEGWGHIMDIVKGDTKLKDLWEGLKFSVGIKPKSDVELTESALMIQRNVGGPEAVKRAAEISALFGGLSSAGSLQGFENEDLSFLGSPTSNNSRSINVDRVEISVNGGSDSAETIANSVYNMFQQAAEDLETPVDQ